jgi:dTDP-4-dehydrorhamnose reductase
VDPVIWLIGNKGMLGTELAGLLDAAGLSYIGSDREVDITDPASLAAFAGPRRADWIINCAAYTAVDQAEDDVALCRRLNTDGPANIARIACGAKLIHISTDYVFNGKGDRPYQEDDPTDPIGVYGRTKRDGEVAALAQNSATYIIRTAWLYGQHGSNFVHTMLRLMAERSRVSVVNDQRGCPTWARNLAETIITLLRQSGEKQIPYGIYHYTNTGVITWFDFACAIYERALARGLLSRPCEIAPCRSAEFPATVQRPAYSALDTAKIRATLGIEIASWDESLQAYLQSKKQEG